MPKIFLDWKLKKEENDAATKNIVNIFRPKREHKANKDRVSRDIGNIFEHKEEDFYKPLRESNYWSKNYIEYKSKGNRKSIPVEEYHNKNKLYLKHINNLKKSDTWRIQLTITINLFSSKDDNDEERVMN